MAKLTFIEQELNEGINRVQVAHIKPDHVKPPKNAFCFCELPLMDMDESLSNGVNKYEADVNVTKDIEGNISSITLVSGLIEKDQATIEADPKYIATVDELRKKEYAKEVDGLNFKLVELLADGIIKGKVKIDGVDSETLAQEILTKKQAIKDKIK